VAVAEGGIRGEIREYGRLANTPTALDRLARQLGNDGVKPRFCYEDGVIPAPRFRSDPAARRCTVASTGGPAVYYIGVDVSSKESTL
jgi:hypothetical protein